MPRDRSYAGSADKWPGTRRSTAGEWHERECRRSVTSDGDIDGTGNAPSIAGSRQPVALPQSGHTNPLGQRCWKRASWHCASVPYCLRKAGNDRPGWSWIGLRAMSLAPVLYITSAYIRMSAAWLIKVSNQETVRTENLIRLSVMRGNAMPDRYRNAPNIQRRLFS
jgi:hypothetical protein